ncbi:hypothetical protein DPMN_003843 [Dreissena polymorpha]|uniref:Uncharacterized protein n=1 Tax=Dreissena polymorpha TaxID=45954 RepID=A0A9D4RVC2_DREPO|nr:hypothetical protein DPMN_003843 [Dreissena polymorpha]
MKSKVLMAVYVFLKFVDLKVMIRLEKTITHYAFEIDSLSLDKFKTQTEAFGFTYITQIALNILILGLREEHLNQAKKKLDYFREAFPNEVRLSVSPYQRATVRHRIPRETTPNKLYEALLSRGKRSAHLVCEPY